MKNLAMATYMSAQPPGKKPDEENSKPVNPFVFDDLEDVDVTAESTRTDSGIHRLEDVLKALDEKIQSVTTEFAKGNINQAQFQAIFTRYREQREIIIRIRRKDPGSAAWQKVAVSGHTNFLRQQHAARLFGLHVADNRTQKVLRTLGTVKLRSDLLTPLLQTIGNPVAGLGTQSTQIDGGQWLVFVPGDFTTVVALFSQEPAQAQLAGLENAHREFEELNHHDLASGVYDANLLEYNHGVLLEDQ